MRTVVFDLLFAQPLGGAKFHGGGEYIKSVFYSLVKNMNPDTNLIVCYNQNKFLDEWILNEIHRLDLKIYNVETVHDIEIVLNNLAENNTITFFTGMIYQYTNINLKKNVYTIGVCHGLRPIEKLHDLEEWRYYNGIKEWIELARYFMKKKNINESIKDEFKSYLSKFNVVITDSLHSEYSIKTNFPDISSKIKLFTFYAPLKHLEKEDLVAEENGYIMMISANRWLKNSYRGICALDSLYEKGYLKDKKTKIYGNFPSRMVKKLKNPAMFEFFGYVNTEELEKAYKGCSLFFYPTLNEGFGLPPMEAMKYGKTSVISAVSSLPEIYKDAVYYCNPYDIGEMSNRILMAIENPISKDVIYHRVSQILEKQNNDTKKLCHLINSGSVQL